MSAVLSPARPASPSAPPARTLARALSALAIVALLAAAVVFGQLGCERMRQAAPLGKTDTYGRTASGYGWSLEPLGFVVRYNDGTSETRLWWSADR